MTLTGDQEDRRPSDGELAETAAMDEQIRQDTERRVARIVPLLGFADYMDLISAVCDTPWDPAHPGHEETCRRLARQLRTPVARIIDRHHQQGDI